MKSRYQSRSRDYFMVFVSDLVSTGTDFESRNRSRSRLGRILESRTRIEDPKCGLVSVWRLEQAKNLKLTLTA